MSDRATLVDGEFEDRVPASDRGLLFGDHVFETMLWNGHSVPLWAFHWQRLTKGCEALGFECPSEAWLLADIDRLMGGQDAQKTSVLRMTVTRGSSATGYWVPEDIKPRRILQRRDFPSQIEQQSTLGLRLATTTMTLPTIRLGTGLKHGNRLFQVMCARECARLGVDEVLVYRDDGYLAEAMASNVILVKSGRLMTPDCPDVFGVGLEWVESLQLGLKRCPLTRSDINDADEVILINSVSGPRPVVELDGRSVTTAGACELLQGHWQGGCLS